MIFATTQYELQLWEQGFKLICGIDEVGRGCFAGPVVAGAVIFPQGISLPEGIADSKLLKPKTREELAEEIKKVALAWSVGEIDVPSINKFGIGKATQMAFLQAVNNLSKIPDFLVIDAFFIDNIDRKIQKPIKNGDKLSVSIAAASIVAKVYRDNLMVKEHKKYPVYGFDQHKGYGTKLHQDAIKKHGLSELHRTSFNLKKFLPQNVIPDILSPESRKLDPRV